MSDPSEFIVWPLADARTMAIAITIGLGILAVAVLIELRRRQRDRKMLREAELRTVQDLLDEREVHGEERSLLLAIIHQYEPEHPGRVVSRRLVFDRCMQRYFQAIRIAESGETLARRGAQLRDLRSRLGLDYVPIGRRIHSTRELYDGQILWGSPASGLEPRWFHFKTLKVDEAFFYLAAVGHDGTPEFIPDELVKFRMWREDDARYLFETTICQKEKEPRVWRVNHADSLTRNQARAHYRIRFDATVPIGILNGTPDEHPINMDTNEAVTQIYGRITSLSGGGMAVHFQQPVPKQVLMRVPFQLSDSGHPIVAYVRPTSAQNVGGGRSIVRGRFVAMDDETRDVITRYIFLKQKQSASEDSYSL